MTDRRLGAPGAPPPRLLTNVDPALAAGWHPVARGADVVPGSSVTVRLLGGTWTIERLDAAGIVADPAPWGITERFGLVWLAPSAPVADLIHCPAYDDATFPRAWLPVERTSAPAGLLADNFVDIAHFPFVHASSFADADEVVVPRYDVDARPAGFDYRYEHLYLNHEDPGVATGLRPLQQTRIVTCTFDVPFQLTITLEHVESGGTTVVLFFLQPEDLDATRAYTCVLRREVGGVPTDLDAAVAFEHQILLEDLALQERLELPGLPLDLGAEVHIRADVAGVELRRAYARLTEHQAVGAFAAVH